MVPGAMNAFPRGLARYAEELPDVETFLTLGEGDTPFLPLPKLASHLGVSRISAKMELYNPTGSYKDRVAAMSMSVARERGNRGWITTSTGNAGLAMAAYGVQAELPGFLCVSAAAPVEKLTPLMPYPVHVIGIEGLGTGATIRSADELFDEVSVAARRHDLFLGIFAHSVNHDGMRGADTIGYELAEQAPSISHVYVPTGSGGLLASIGRGLERRGSRARLVACQPAGCAPIVHFVAGVSNTPKVYKVESGISGLQVPNPADGRLAAQAVDRSRGWGTVANDEEILAAQRMLVDIEGIFVEPAAAAGVAALLKDIEHGRIDSYEHPVLILTGAGWKDLSRFRGLAERVPVVPHSDVVAHVDRWADQLITRNPS